MRRKSSSEWQSEFIVFGQLEILLIVEDTSFRHQVESQGSGRAEEEGWGSFTTAQGIIQIPCCRKARRH